MRKDQLGGPRFFAFTPSSDFTARPDPDYDRQRKLGPAVYFRHTCRQRRSAIPWRG